MSVMIQDGFETVLAGAEACGEAGRVVAVIGMRGGCGATTVATWLAWMIGNADAGAEGGERCILVDLDVHFGSAAMSLGVAPGDGLLTMLAAPERVDLQLVADSLLPVNDRFGMIAAQVPMAQEGTVSAAGVAAMLAALRRSARWVVADVPRGLDAAARHVLRTADQVVVVTPPSLEGLRDTRRILAWLSAWRVGAPPLVVVNGASAGGGEIRRKVFEETTGQPVAAWIGAMNGPASAASAHALPLAAVAGGKRGNPFAALTAQVTGALPAARRARLPAGWPMQGANA